MADRCDGTSRRSPDYSSNETSCEPTREEAAAAQAGSQQAAEREAEARRNAYFASGADEGGRSMRAASDTGALQTSTPDSPYLRIVANSMKLDHPIQSDPLGNALIGIVGGGIIGGVEAGVGKVGLSGAGGMFLQPASRALVNGTVIGEATGVAAFARGAAAGAGTTAASQARKAVLLDGIPAAAVRLVEASQSKPTSPADGTPSQVPAVSLEAGSSVAGQSSKSGASVPAKEPTSTQGPRIPEAWPALPTRIQG